MSDNTNDYNVEQIGKSIRYGIRVYAFSPDVVRQLYSMSDAELRTLAEQVDVLTAGGGVSILDAVYTALRN